MYRIFIAITTVSECVKLVLPKLIQNMLNAHEIIKYSTQTLNIQQMYIYSHSNCH